MNQPLAVRMRPTNLDEIVGQDHLLAPGSALRRLVETDASNSVFLWGPPGVGKTTIARIVADTTAKEFVELSAVNATIKDVREAITAAQKRQDDSGTGTVLFIDEIHRFNKTQQDALLPAVENRTVTFIAATTENPSFSVISPLLSRSILLTLKPLSESDVAGLIDRTMSDPRGLDNKFTAPPEVLSTLARLAGGDARRSLTYLEEAAASAQSLGVAEITEEIVLGAVDRTVARYDRDGDMHYDVISAFIKSMRGSDVNAALHWLARMVDAGEDPRFIARRIMIHAAEDVGMADPMVLLTAVAAAQASALVGFPEAEIILAQAVIAVATAPKSPQVNASIKAARADTAAGITGPVPMHLRDAHYPGAKMLGHGSGYLFPHDYPHGVVAQQYLPNGLEQASYYEPTDNGFEKTIAARMAAIERLTQEDPHVE